MLERAEPAAPTSEVETGRAPSLRKRQILEQADRLAPIRDRWIRRNRYFFEEDQRYMRFLVPREAVQLLGRHLPLTQLRDRLLINVIGKRRNPVFHS